jgi:two-component system, LytTR family, response regulator
MKRAIIIDDEDKSRATLSSFISKYCPTLTIVDLADGVATGIASIKKHSPDVVFLDIEMDDGTGFDVIEGVTGVTFDLIFVTAYNQYALKAFRYSAIDYLLKPINPEELIQAVNKLSDSSRLDQIEQKLEVLLLNQNALKKIAFPSLQGLRLEEPQNIAYCESDNYYTNIHLKNGEKLVISKTLKEYDQMLQDEGFFRAHQKYLVNISFISSYAKSDGGYLTLENGAILPVSRRKKDELLKLIS